MAWKTGYTFLMFNLSLERSRQTESYHMGLRNQLYDSLMLLMMGTWHTCGFAFRLWSNAAGLVFYLTYVDLGDQRGGVEGVLGAVPGWPYLCRQVAYAG